MQAIILAAGMGRRLGALTDNKTKCMVEVNGKTLIDRMLNQLSQTKINRVILVIGFEGKKVKDLIGHSYANMEIMYVENPVYDKTNNIYSLYLAKEYLLREDTLLLESDLIFEKKILDKVLDDSYPNLALVDRYQSWMDGTVVEIDEENTIKSFVPKSNFKFEDIPKYYKTVNIYKFSKEFASSHYVPFLEAYSKALGNNEYYEQVLRVITLLEKPNIKALPLNGEAWYEVDDIQDLDNAETIFADENQRLSSIERRYGGYWRYPKMIDFCYLVNPFFPPTKLIEEIKANFQTLLSQYPSGLNVNNLLAAKYFSIKEDYIIVGNGAAEIINGYFSNTGKVTGVILPTFEEYKNRIKDDNLKVYFIPEKDGFTYTADDLIAFYSKNRIEQLILINPDNPSGNFIPKQDVIRLLNWAKLENIRLILDESFVDFSTEGHLNSLITNKILEEYSNLVIIKSISKSYGVPGLRLGIVATSDQEILREIRQNISIWNINSFAEFYMQIFGKYEKDYIDSCLLFREERNRFYIELQDIPYLKVFSSQANYFLCELKKGESAQLTDLLLKKHNILIKDCSGKTGFNNKPYIRIAVRDKVDNEKLIKALKEIEL